MARRSGLRPLLRWVTWWPVPYWTDRFNRLAERDEIRFEAIFLVGSDTQYRGLTQQPEEWRFSYRILDPRPSEIGFFRHRRLPGNPLPLVRGDSSLRLVMSYADPAYLAAAALARARGVGYSLFVANTRFDQRPESAAREFLKRRMLRQARSLLVTGPLQREYALVYAPQAQVAVIGNPVDPSRLAGAAGHGSRADLRRALGWSDGQVVLLFVGRLEPEKDLATLVQAAAELRAGGDDVVLSVVGAGSVEEELRGLATELGVPADFRGFREGRELADLYATADVFVLPSASEAWGLVVNEAMQAGLPVLVSDRVGSRHLIAPGVNGETFPCGDASALAAKLAPYVRDPRRRVDAGAAGRSIIGAETIDAWIDRVLDGVGLT